ncbi:MAG: PBP1A family penicillin-binding protein [Pseudomonadota bacterium]|nr:PBP1A family penicillin-binding protein [Pseudomonadota bacterium]MEC8727064.1 PBP1A family penicillin-binding protein [Pseudomonadota bacterium]
MPKHPRAGSRASPGAKKRMPSRDEKHIRAPVAKGKLRAKNRFRRQKVVFRLFKWSLILAIWSTVALSGLVAWYAWDLPDINKLESQTRRASIILTDSAGQEIATYGDLYGELLRLADLPPHLVQAIIATEDRRFFDHSGLDPAAMLRATIANVRAGRLRQGGSTLTQQLAKNLFLKPERTLRRKVQELLLAFWLETNFSKEQIFTLYINRVYLGAGAYGVDAAARRYFGRSAKTVSLHQAAVIAGLLKAPSRYSPLRSRGAAEGRAKIVLNAMVKAGFIDLKTARKVGSQRLRIVPRSASHRTARYFSDWVFERVHSFVGGVESDLIVRTTMDRRLQAISEEELSGVLLRRGAPRNIGQGALVSMSPTGAIRSMVGGRDYSISQYNRASQARRQPGSAFKLFVYLAALEHGMLPQDQLIDRPLKIGNWQPRNYVGTYEGIVTLKESLARSINTIAVQVSERVGRNNVIDAARRLGITSPLKSHPSLALGVTEVSLMELTAAYSVVANGGFAVWPHAIIEIRTSGGEVLYRRQDGAVARVIDEDVVSRLDEMLRAVIAVGTGRAANSGRPAAGKTGTSQGFRDAWFVGYTDQLVTGIWMGNDDSSPMKRVTGGGYPAQLWASYTRSALQGRPVTPQMTPPEAVPAFGRGLGSSLLDRLKRSVGASTDYLEKRANTD